MLRCSSAVGAHRGSHQKSVSLRQYSTGSRFTLPPKMSAEESVKVIKSGDRVFVHSVAAAPRLLIDAMVDRAPELRNVEIVHMHTEGSAPYTDPKYEESFFSNNFFVGHNVRKPVQEGRAGYVPTFLSEVPLLFTRGILPLDVAMFTVSPPDAHGYCSLGTSVDISITAFETAKIKIAQINPNMPRTHGDGVVHVSKFNNVVECNDPLYLRKTETPSESDMEIGKHIASLVEDGATLQMGIGSIPDACLKFLSNHKDLGVHSEMFSDGLIPLVESGVINGSKKKIHQGQVVSGFTYGSARLYEFLHDNPIIKMMRISDVNNPLLILQNPKVTAINSAIEIDLTGQICADSIGSRIHSGVGGQMDFMRAAALSQGGRPIIALNSLTKKGGSKIVPTLKPGAGVVTTRAHAHHIVTEFGQVNLFGKNTLQRAEALISIAHPDHRESLAQSLADLYPKRYTSGFVKAAASAKKTA